MKDGETEKAGSGWKRLGWFALIWVASLIVMLAFTYGLRAIMQIFF